MQDERDDFFEERDVHREKWDAEIPPAPDAIGLVTEVADMMAMFAAQQFMRIEGLRRDAIDDAGRYGGSVAAVIERSVRLELAAALRITEHAAAALLATAESLVHRYPTALDSLSVARMTERHAHLIVDSLNALETDVAARVLPQAIALAEALPVGSFRRSLRTLIEAERADTLEQRHSQALEARRVYTEAADDGMAWLHALLPAVEGAGPVTIARARELCGDAGDWMRILTHPETGMVLSVGRTRYRPPPELRRLVRWRADRCMAPGCGVPASRCEIDHTVAWEHGGSTSLENLAPLCKGHHTVKHHGGWEVAQIDDSGGALQWTSPSGRRYRVDPEHPVLEHRFPVFRRADAEVPPF